MIDTLLALFGLLVLIIVALGLVAMLWRTWWLYPAWAWFIVPLGVRPISFWHFAALMFIASVATSHMDTKEDLQKTSWPAVVASYLWPTLAWLMLLLMKRWV